MWSVETLATQQWFWLGLAVMLVAMSKAGITGIGNLAIPMLALVFGGKASTGILLPILVMADLMAILFYRRTVEWKYLRKLLPWSILGIILGTWLGKDIPANIFLFLMGIVILIGVLVTLYMEFRKVKKIPDFPGLSAGTGILGGVSTMIGNAAGPIMSVYFLAMQLPKNIFIGTKAWFFFILNFSKVPLHVFFWETISWDTFLINLCTLPFIIIGAFIGKRVVKYIPEKGYRWLIIGVTGFAAIVLLSSAFEQS